jgi:ABC-type branched-subunit amino acid transport system substrate-binding protein
MGPGATVPAILRLSRQCAAAFGLVLCLLWWGGQPARAEEIVLGMSAAFSGPSKGLGIELYRGSMAYFEHVNSQGGVHGRKITIKAYDDGYNPTPAIDNTIRLIDTDHAFLLFNYVGTPTTTRCLPLLKRYRDQSVLLFFPFTGAQPQRHEPYGEFVFNLRASYHQETAGLVDHLVEIGRKRVAVFYQIDAYGRNGWEGVRLALARHGLKITGEATYRRGTTYQESLHRQVDILRETDADAVISIGSYAACAAFIRDARDAGWNVPIANVSFVGSESLLELLQETGKTTGADYTKDLINSQVVPSYHDLTLPAVREYRQLMESYQAMPPPELLKDAYQPLRYSFVGLEGFLNAKLLVSILDKMGPPFERERLKQASESTADLDLGMGVPISFGKARHQAIDQVYYTVVRDGRFEPLEDWKRWHK